MDAQSEVQPASPIVDALRHVYHNHLTKILGYAQIAAGAIVVMDPQLVADTLGPNAIRWALVVSGVLTALRGHTSRPAK